MMRLRIVFEDSERFADVDHSTLKTFEDPIRLLDCRRASKDEISYRATFVSRAIDAYDVTVNQIEGIDGRVVRLVQPIIDSSLRGCSISISDRMLGDTAVVVNFITIALDPINSIRRAKLLLRSQFNIIRNSHGERLWHN